MGASATKNMDNQGLMGRVLRIESGYLRVVRAVLATAVIVGVLALVGAAAFYSYGYFAAAGDRSAANYIKSPDWESISQQVLPTFTEAPVSADGSGAAEGASSEDRRGVDQRVLRIAEHLDAQFSRNAGHETGFTDRYPTRLLESWIMEGSVPPTFLDIYIDELIGISKAIGEDGRINRIGSIDDRAQVIMDALQAFNRAFLARIGEAEELAAEAQATAIAESAEAAGTALLLGVGGLGLLVCVLLTVLLIRIEAHLHDQVRLQRLAREDPPQGLSVSCALGVVLLVFGGAPSTEAAADELSECDWTIVSDAADRSGQSREEVEDQLLEELAIKLKQFDECTERMASSQADAGADAGAVADADAFANPDALADVGGGAGSDSRADEQGQYQRRDQAGRDARGRADDWTAGEEVAGSPTMGSQRVTRAGRPRTDERYPRADERYPRTDDRYPRADDRYPRADERYPTAGERYPRAGTERGTAHQAGRPSGSVRTSPAEDDIARILREAAESETDPSRRAALWEEYENYVKNL